MLFLCAGKGNSDMDEEDVLRNGNQLLKMPTLVVRQNDQTITTTQHRLNHDSGLLMKPKLELEQTQWGASKIQPRLDSSDFISKTHFANSTKFTGGSKLTPPSATFGSPSHPGSFSSGLLNGNLSWNSTDLKSGILCTPPHPSQSLSHSHPGTSTSFSAQQNLFANSTIGFASSNGTTFNSQRLTSGIPFMSGLMQSTNINGSVFKAPRLLQSNAGSFGSYSGFASKPQTGLFGSISHSGFGQKAPSFGTSKFGMPVTSLSSIVASVAFQPKQPRVRNGDMNDEPVFGSREKVRNTVITKEEKLKPASAFEQYAGVAGAATSNPFADAMRKAKNPSPKQVNSDDLFDEYSSSYYSETDSEESEESITTDEEDEDVSLGEETDSVFPADDAVSVPGEIGSTPSQSWLSPIPLTKSPLKQLASPTKSLTSPQLNNHGISTLSEHNHEAHSPKPSSQKIHTNELQSQPASSNSSVVGSPAMSSILEASLSDSGIGLKKTSLSVSAKTVLPPRRDSLRSPDRGPNKSHASPSKNQPNGDIGLPSLQVSGHIDLEKPALSLSIPKALLTKPSKTRRPPRRNSARTPNPYMSTPSYRTTKSYNKPQQPSDSPNYAPPTPAYFTPATPMHRPATPPYHGQASLLPPATPIHAPPTPVHAPATPLHIPTPVHTSTLASAPVMPSNKYNPRIHAPTKEQMMRKRKPKTRIGPKSFLLKRGLIVKNDSVEEHLDNAHVFKKSELLSTTSGRTDPFAPHQSRFRQNQKYLCYLRRRACDLIVSLFPDLRYGGNFSCESEDVDGLIEYIIICLENQDPSTRCMPSKSSARKELEVSLCRASKATIRTLERKLCKLLKLMLPSINLDMLETEGIKTLPALIHKVITENVT